MFSTPPERGFQRVIRLKNIDFMGVIHVFHIVVHILMLKRMWNLLKNTLYKQYKNIR